MKHVKLFEQFVNEKEELYTAYIEDGREPGGTDKEIKKDYDLEVTNRATASQTEHHISPLSQSQVRYSMQRFI